MKLLLIVITAVVIATAHLAHGQPAPATPPEPAPAEPVVAGEEDAEDAAEPGVEAAPSEAPAALTARVAPITPPPQWSEWEIKGRLFPSDTAETVRAVLTSEMRTHRALTDAAQSDLAAACQKYGYQLVRFETIRLTGGGVRAVLHLEPVPMIRQVVVSIVGSLTTKMISVVLDDDMRRRMRLRVGGTLPWDQGARQTALDEEAQRVGEFLRDEGFFDAGVEIRVDPDDVNGVAVEVRLRLGRPYHLGQVRIASEADLAIGGPQIRSIFKDRNLCEWFLRGICPVAFRTRFTRARHQAALQEITAMFRNRGYPAVKVSSDFDPATSFDRRRHAVDIALTIDQRRYVDVVFEGNDKDARPDEALRKRLTFTEAASADEFEVQASANALHEYYQTRGYFDAIVTWTREPFRAFDRIVYRIDEGTRRTVKGIAFRVTPGDGQPAAMDNEALRSAVGAGKYEDRWIGSTVRPTSATLAEDVEKVRRAYRDRGYFEAQVSAHVAPDPATMGSAAISGALLAARRRPGDLYLRYDIVEGPRTLLDQIRITFDGPHRSTCAQLLRQIGSALGVADMTARITPSDPCIAAGIGRPIQQDNLESAGIKLKDWYWGIGRPRAEIQLKVAPGPTRRRATIATFRVREHREVRLGKVLVRGNFRTRPWVLLDELDFDENEMLTGDVYQDGPRALRTSGLFNAVNVELVNLDDPSEDVVHAVARVEERNVGSGTFQLEAGISSLKGTFFTVQPILPNLPAPWRWPSSLAYWLGERIGQTWGSPCRSCGIGLRLSLGATIGFKDVINGDPTYSYGSAEASLRAPRWIARRLIGLAFDTELAGFWREQETERFGRLRTIGVSLAATRVWQWQRTETTPARSLALTLPRFDARFRNRDDDAIRPAGADIEESRVPVPTNTGSVGFEVVWDQRTDRLGNLSPLTPERGFQLQFGASYAHPYFLFGSGQDTFIKGFVAGQAYKTITDRILLRVDGRYDQGIPRGGAVLLPEVERFFAGGDTTVRGFEEDRLATEIVETSVPPLSGASQVRVLPAGGNLRLLGSIEAQLRVARLPGTSLPLASAVFVDAGVIRNSWDGIQLDDIRPSFGLSLIRVLTPVGSFAVDYAVPMFPELGDNPRGRLHVSVALRN